MNLIIPFSRSSRKKVDLVGPSDQIDLRHSCSITNDSNTTCSRPGGPGGHGVNKLVNLIRVTDL